MAFGIIPECRSASFRNKRSASPESPGKIDITLDAAGPLAREYGNGKNAVDLPIEEFMVPLATMVKSRFVTSRAAARHMIKQHSGVIIFVTGSPEV
jgi:NAD(P)-dependent dehydrogenase (short-subunit alcohol dehydrogenase family)